MQWPKSTLLHQKFFFLHEWIGHNFISQTINSGVLLACKGRFFALGRHLGFGSCGWPSRVPVKHPVTIQDGGIKDLAHQAIHSKITLALQALHHHIMMLVRSLQSTQEQKSCSQQHLKQLIHFFHALHLIHKACWGINALFSTSLGASAF